MDITIIYQEAQFVPHVNQILVLNAILMQVTQVQHAQTAHQIYLDYFKAIIAFVRMVIMIQDLLYVHHVRRFAFYVPQLLVVNLVLKIYLDCLLLISAIV